MARKAAQNAHQKGGPQRNRTTTPSTKPRPRPITLAGINEVPTTDMEPGAPDAVDLAETARPMSPQAAKELALAAGDLDASFHGLESGEEAPGGSDQTPGQDDVDRIGTALGVVEQDEKPLATTEKIEGRDRERWELDPASSEDYAERQQVEVVTRRRRQR